MAGAIEANNGDQNFGYCVFERNTAQYGAHIRMNGGSANLFNCVLGRGYGYYSGRGHCLLYRSGSNP